MKQRRFQMLGLLVLLLMAAGCSQQRDDRLEAAIHARYGGEALFSTVIQMRLNQGNFVSDYTLSYAGQPENGHILTVTAPSEVAGLAVQVRRDKTIEVTYDGAVFLPANLDGTTLSPIAILCDLISNWQAGYADSVQTEKQNGQTVVIWTAFSDDTGEEMTYRTVFQKDTLEPRRAECFHAGVCVLSLSFSAQQWIKT